MFAIVLVRAAKVDAYFTGVNIVAQNDVDDASDRVGAILCGGAVSQYLNAFDRARWYGVQIGAGGTASDRTVDVYERAVVATFAVDQHKHLIWM